MKKDPTKGLITTPAEYNERIYGNKSNAFSKKQYPKVNAKERSKKLFDEFREWQKNQGKEYLETLKNHRQANTQDTIKYLAPIIEKIALNKKEWTGTHNVARWIENRLKKAKVAYRRKNAMSGSVYFDLIDGNKSAIRTLRVSDHEQIPGSGFNIDINNRMGEADIDLTPNAELNRQEALDEFLKNNSIFKMENS